MSAKCLPGCRCGGTGFVERGPSGATYSYPCYPWDCHVIGCKCKVGTEHYDGKVSRSTVEAALRYLADVLDEYDEDEEPTVTEARLISARDALKIGLKGESW